VRKVQAEFSGNDITRDGGVLLPRDFDCRFKLLKSVDAIISDSRESAYIARSHLSLLRKRVYGLCLGYEDLNDHHELRNDPAIQASVEYSERLGGCSVYALLPGESFDRQVAVQMHQVLIVQFIASFNSQPDELILGFDATDDPTHGEQEGHFFNGNYDHYCFLPLYVFCGGQLLAATYAPATLMEPNMYG